MLNLYQSGQCHDGKLVTKDGRPLAKCVKQACTLPAVQNGTVSVKSPGVTVVSLLTIFIMGFSAIQGVFIVHIFD